MPSTELEAESPPAGATAHLRPRYSDDFRCLASACTENCCNGWTIPVDRATYRTYREHPVLKPFAESLIVLNPASRSAGDFASMPLTHHGTCAFLDEQKLCGIHKHFGAPLLSSACASYPREIAQVGGSPEAALSLSCPEAARLTLLNPALLDPSSTDPSSTGLRVPRLAPGFNPVLALRDLSLRILTHRALPLGQRLDRLGMLAQRLQALSHPAPAAPWAQAHPQQVAALIEQVVDELDSALPRLVQPHTALQLHFIARVLRQRLADPPVPNRFREAADEFAAGLAWTPTQPIAAEPIAVRYTQARDLYLLPLLQRHPYLIENFLANHIFKYHFPFGRHAASEARPATPAGEHRALTLFAAVLQILLAGIAAHHREAFSTTHVLQLVQGFSKAIEHRRRSVEDLHASASALHLDEPASLALLLANF